MEINNDEQRDASFDGNVEQHIQILETNQQERNEKFKFSTFKSKFQIINLPANPENLLKEVFAKCLDDAIELSTQKYGEEPDRLGALISSALLDYDIYIPIRKIKEDTLDNLFNRFILIMQSREKQGYGNIYGEPFSIVVHTVNAASLPSKPQIRGSGQRKIAPIHHNPRSCALIKVKNLENPYCLFYALELTRIYASKELDKRNFSKFLNHKQQQQRQHVIDLMTNAGVPLHGLISYDATVYAPMIVDYWNSKYSAKNLIYKIFIFKSIGHFEAEYTYGPDNFNTPISIYHDNDHFEGIRNVGGMFKEGYKYCFACQCPYRNARDHTVCKAKCRNCGQVGTDRPCPHEDFFKRCNLCNKTFRNKNCYDQHQASGECGRVKLCDKCGTLWNVRNLKKNGRNTHVCGERFCKTCIQFHNPDRGCFIQPLVYKEPKPYRLITFDFESTQDESFNAAHPERKRHRVNFITANVACTSCLQNGEWKKSLEGKSCEICGHHRTITFSHREFTETRVDKKIVTDEPLKAFVEWILFKQNKKFTTMAFSHYGGKYDMILTFREIFMRKLTPKIIRRGNKLYEMHVRPNKQIENGEVFFRDSFNLCPVSLGALVGAFDLNIQEKQFFPHLANISSNYDKVIDLPPKSDYLYGGFPVKKQKEFDVWYENEQRTGAKFNLTEKLAEYCLSDVQILTEALVAFRKEFLKISDLDILRVAMTIASACMKHFRLNHLKENHLAIVPELGYDRRDTQSSLALKYFQWYSDKTGLQIQTSMSEKGEHKVGRYKVDGYIEEEDRVIEVNGCLWHGHECRFKNPGHVLPNGKTVEWKRNYDAARIKYLNTQLKGGVTQIWECEIKEQLKNDPEMRKSFDEYEDEGPIRIRDGFFGGRTGPFRMHYECPPGYKMKYFDFCSLYPFTTTTTKFPVGHPKIHVNNRANQGVNWTDPDQIPIKGFLKVFIVPPRKVKIPVMPVKFDDRLLFPLCRACAQKFPTGKVTPNYSCPHYSEKSRGWVSTCTHMELAESLKSGYRVTKYYRSWEYENWDDEVFRNYVAEMMERKIHASGFPEGIDEKKYIQECREMFGINLDPNKMNKNAAMRIIAKLMNNNLWGRFSLRNDLSRTKITDCPAKLRKYLENESIEVVSLDVLTPDVIMITYVQPEEFIEENASSNLMLSLWVTSAARIKLLHVLQKVADCPGAVLCYCDTDSVVFAYPENQPCPLETGPHLGDLTDEYPLYDLVEFISGGCKNYALRMLDKRTGEEKTVLRVRGITLTGDVCKKLHFETMKDSVLKFAMPANGDEPMEIDEQDYYYISTSYPHFIQPNLKQGCVITRSMEKCYRPIVTKGIVCKDMIIKDFGSE